MKLPNWLTRLFTKQSDDLVISMLRYGKQHLVEGVTYQSTDAHLKQLNYEYEGERFKYLFFKVFDAIDEDDRSRNFAYHIEQKTKQAIKIDSYFNLLEHDELSSARGASRNATIFAGFAIFISVAAFAYSIVSTERVRVDDQQVLEFQQSINSEK